MTRAIRKASRRRFIILVALIAGILSLNDPDPVKTLFTILFKDVTFGVENDDYDWTLERIEKSLGVPIPQDAVDVRYEGEWGRLTELELTFQAPPQSMDEFMSHFCQGISHQHYDPFRAIDLAKRVDYQFAVYMEDRWPSNYYSYSPNASDSLFGNRCDQTDRDFVKIVVDKSNAQNYALRMFYRLGRDQVNLDHRLPESPFLLRGLWLRDEYTFDLRLCIDTDPIEFMRLEHGLIGRFVEIYVGKSYLPLAGRDYLPLAHISENGRLRMDDDLTENADEYFTYCYDTRLLEPGPYTLTLKVSTLHGDDLEYSLPITAK